MLIEYIKTVKSNEYNTTAKKLKKMKNFTISQNCLQHLKMRPGA